MGKKDLKRLYEAVDKVKPLAEKDGQDGEKQIQPWAQKLFDDFSQMLSNNIHNELDQLEEL